jgi:hypothetical protein
MVCFRDLKTLFEITSEFEDAITDRPKPKQNVFRPILIAECTESGKVYLEKLRNFLCQFQNKRLQLMEPLNFHKEVMDFSNATFSEKRTVRGEPIIWPPRSPYFIRLLRRFQQRWRVPVTPGYHYASIFCKYESCRG